LLPTTYDGHKLVYLNSHFRFSRYNTGGQFPIHYDGTNYDNDRHAEFGSTKSVFTLNIFLNDDFEGGHTIFYHDPSHIRFDAEPKVGRAALFYAQQPHCGTKVLSPYKYLLRTDVMGIME
jgi:predicted 2-oxoglutarate/Fe(II)-dependent dioxygenase YbiX